MDGWSKLTYHIAFIKCLRVLFGEKGFMSLAAEKLTTFFIFSFFEDPFLQWCSAKALFLRAAMLISCCSSEFFHLCLFLRNTKGILFQPDSARRLVLQMPKISNRAWTWKANSRFGTLCGLTRVLATYKKVTCSFCVCESNPPKMDTFSKSPSLFLCSHLKKVDQFIELIYWV